MRLKNSLNENMPISEKRALEEQTINYVASLTSDGMVTRDGYNFWIDAIVSNEEVDAECENFNLVRVD